MEDARGKRRVDIRFFENRHEILGPSRSARGDERNPADGAHGFQLLHIVPRAGPIRTHAVENDLPGAKALDFVNPVEGPLRKSPRPLRIARVLSHAPFVVRVAQ